MEELDKGIKFTRGVPLDRWDSNAYIQLYENQYQEALKRLEKFKQDHAKKLEEIIKVEKKKEDQL